MKAPFGATAAVRPTDPVGDDVFEKRLPNGMTSVYRVKTYERIWWNTFVFVKKKLLDVSRPREHG